MGRVWRHPQPKTCIKYELIANSSADLLMEGVSTEKGLMHAKLMNSLAPLRE